MDAPEKIWAWEIDHETIPPNGYYATDEVDDGTEYTRTDRANELVAAAYEVAALEASEWSLAARSYIRDLTPADAVAALAARDARIREAALREAADAARQTADESDAPHDVADAIEALIAKDKANG